MRMRTLARTLIVAAFLCGSLYLYRDQAHTVVAQLAGRFAPCASPISYTIGSVDPRFGISKSAALAAVKEAEAVWETPSRRNLFEYDPKNAELTINLVFDYRQQTTQKLKGLGLEVEDTRVSYDALKEKYDSLHSDYQQKKAAFDTTFAAYEADQAAYNRDVEHWNAQDGAPQQEFDRLQEQKAALRSERARVQQLQDEVNADVGNVNALASALNQTASALNLDVARYNTIGESTGNEFEEGVYESAPGSQKIDIYEFGSEGQLVRVLAHELGHALGLEHVSDPSAIMYRVNQSTNGRTTAADLAELSRVCLPAQAGGTK